MKKIGILTFHRSVNNGAVMQAYSLSKRLIKDYPDFHVEIIDYHMPKVSNTYHYTILNYIKSDRLIIVAKKAVRLLFDPLKLKRLNYRTEIFQEAIKRLPLSEYRIEENSTQALYEKINQEYDVIIVGSDAVWNYITRGFPNAYFPDRRVKCLKLSYAASCYGMEYLDIEDDRRKTIGEILSEFRFLGVRDTATEDFVKWSGCQLQPVHTCDPTAFLDINDLPIDKEKLNHKLQRKGFDFSRQTIGVMGSEKMLKMIRRFYGKQYQIVSLYNYLRGADVNLYDLNPFEWTYVFRYFKLTFTTYFHGTMLSLRSGVPVICIALDTKFAKNHTPKTLDMLSRLGYQDWYFKTDYVSSNIDTIKEKADELLENPNSMEILQKMDQEAASYLAFKETLSPPPL